MLSNLAMKQAATFNYRYSQAISSTTQYQSRFIFSNPAPHSLPIRYTDGSMDPHRILLCIGLCCWIWFEKRYISLSQYLKNSKETNITIRFSLQEPQFGKCSHSSDHLMSNPFESVRARQTTPSPRFYMQAWKFTSIISGTGAEAGKPWYNHFFCGYFSSMGPRKTGTPRGKVSPIQCKTSRPCHYANSHFWMRESVPSFQVSLLSPRFDWHRGLSLRGEHVLQVKWDLSVPEPHTYGWVSPFFSVKCVFKACVLVSWGNPCLWFLRNGLVFHYTMHGNVCISGLFSRFCVLCSRSINRFCVSRLLFTFSEPGKLRNGSRRRLNSVFIAYLCR